MDKERTNKKPVGRPKKVNGQKKQSVGFSLSADLVEKLAEVAEQNGISMSSLVEKAVREKLKSLPKEPQ
jgi:metal-responsive CopG/Arc/MetJ family transcriptional regulator